MIESVERCDYELENVEILPDDFNGYRKVVLSPEAEHILLFGKGTTVVMDIKTKVIIKEFQYYYDGQWINDSLILFQEGKNFVVRTVCQNTSRNKMPVPHLEYMSNKLIAKEGESSWLVADIEASDGLLCYGYLFSNDFKCTVISTNSGKSYIYDLNGSGRISTLDFGIASDWSDDNDFIMAFFGSGFRRTLYCGIGHILI